MASAEIDTLASKELQALQAAERVSAGESHTWRLPWSPFRDFTNTSVVVGTFGMFGLGSRDCRRAQQGRQLRPSAG